ncbi:MAG: YigZ family protein [Lachnospiraceae bacterium]|nr:YigZ family protein [Lachnospiraceae bacterium]
MKIVYEGGQGEIVEKKSRFICTVKKISSEEEALEFVNEMKKKYWDARHNCMAYVLGDRNEIARFSDDGEPQGTAGKPMLDVITVKDIHNVAVVVTRYFGGVLLGTGGLIRAYQGAVNEGLENSVIIEKYEGVKYSVITDYNGMGKIQYIINMEGYHLLDTIYTDNVEMIVVVENDKCNSFENKITEATAARATVTSVNNVSYGISDNGDYIEL